MVRFEFHLASVLRLRQMQLDAEEERLHLILSDLAEKERSLAAMTVERAEAITFVQSQTNTGSAELRALSAFLLGTSARAATLRELIQKIKEMADEQRRRVMVAQQNERLLEKLKERKLAEWQTQSDRELEIVAQEAWTALQYGRDRTP